MNKKKAFLLVYIIETNSKVDIIIVYIQTYKQTLFILYPMTGGCKVKYI